ncbi:hypothetical protein PAXRUDRAFT_826852 [Paxillus rubicundulus Ve08.2h10]|uniref:Uncharacterized protein n=1 Tax=Paxillus rubicundulus Ve08.2h10 TaxID=930991 RepID=A0A0D0E999_9AGAM|nr:hypothetical protein PAXRUDRAFT_826852 [Paxillus rubicundulus Ve08.2h10]
MDSTSEWAVSTTKYRLNLPFALHSISPALSALHATRASVLHPELSSILYPSHCAKCGAYYFSGDASSHVFARLEKTKTKKKMRKRIPSGWGGQQRVCHTCGFFTRLRSDRVEPTFSPHSNIPQSSVSVQSPSASSSVETTSTRILFSTMKTLSPEPSVSLNPMVGNLPEISTRGSPPPFPKQLPRPRSRRTKTTSTLQDLLAHNRRRDEARKAHGKTKDSHGGLAAFLKDL